MPEFANPLKESFLERENKTGSEDGVDIVNFKTVSCHNLKGPNRSLSINIYKYEQILGPWDSEESTSEPGSEATQKCEKNTASHGVGFSNKMTFFSTFILLASVCCLVMLAATIFFVLGNRQKGTVIFLTNHNYFNPKLHNIRK